MLLGLVAVARMFAGPFDIGGIAVNAPLNPEGFFGLASTILLAWRVGPKVEAPGERMPWWVLAAPLLVSVASQARVLGLYFLSDDFILVEQANQWRWGNLVPVFTSGGGDGFFRPVGLVSLALNAGLAGTDARAWHALSVALHALNVALLTLLAARLGLSSLGAFVAGTLFALHGTHPEAAAWIAGRFDLLATFFTLAGLLLFTFEHRWARIAALVCCLGAVFSKEAAFVFPVLLVLVARLERRSLRLTIPFFALAALAFGYRWMMQGGMGGYVSAESGRPSVFTLGLATTAKAMFVRLWTSLYFPINWSVEPSTLLAALALGMVAAILWLAARSKPGRLVWFSLAALGVSILPPLHLLGGAADLSGGRLLYLPSVWFCVMLAAAVEGVSRKKAQAACAAVILLFHWAALDHNLDSWEVASQQVRQICTTAAEGIVPSAIPDRIQGVPALANGFSQCVALAAQKNAK